MWHMLRMHVRQHVGEMGGILGKESPCTWLVDHPQAGMPTLRRAMQTTLAGAHAPSEHSIRSCMPLRDHNAALGRTGTNSVQVSVQILDCWHSRKGAELAAAVLTWHNTERAGGAGASGVLRRAALHSAGV